MRYQLTTTLFAAIFIMSCEQKSSTEKNIVHTETDSSGWYLQQLDALQKNGSHTTQQFVVKAGSKKIVQASRGFRVTVDPDKLETVSGKAVTGDIEVSIIEARGAEDFIAHDIPTISGGRILESGGSYYIGMRSANEELKLKNNEELTIELPCVAGRNMELFYGEISADGRFNWVPAMTPIVKPDKTNNSDSIVRNITTVRKIPVERIKETDFVLMYADSVMKYRLDSICLNHRTIKREEEIKAMYRPIILRRGFAFGSNGIISQTTMIRPNYSHLNLTRFRTINDTVEISADSMITERIASGKCIEQTDILYYQPLEVKRMGWLNCDIFYKSEQPLIPITLKFDTTDRIKVCKTYYVFKKVNSCLTENFTSAGNKFLSRTTSMPIPKGMILTIKIMAVVNGKLKIIDKEIIADNRNEIEIKFGEEG